MVEITNTSCEQPIEERRTIALIDWAWRTYISHRWAIVLFIGIGLLSSFEALFLPSLTLAPSSFASVLGWSLAFTIVATTVTGTPAAADGRWEQATQRFPQLLAVTLLYAVIVGIGLVALVLPGIYLGARLALAFPACVIDECGVIESFKRSWAIAPGRLLTLVGTGTVWLLGLLLVTAVEILLVILTPSSLLATIIGPVLAASTINPLLPFAVGYVYLERRASANLGHS